ncbi:MAG: hypothetical protein ACLRSW_03400 [Christensenellaceae bacterium]
MMCYAQNGGGALEVNNTVKMTSSNWTRISYTYILGEERNGSVLSPPRIMPRTAWLPGCSKSQSGNKIRLELPRKTRRRPRPFIPTSVTEILSRDRERTFTT